MNVVIAGGGTGGHLYPGIALARAFQLRFPDCAILFIGTERGIESRILPKERFALKTIEVEGWVGKRGIALLRALFHFPKGLIQSYRLLKAFRPDLVIGVGGYASGPVLLMSVILSMKRIILEQNVTPGLTNTILAHFVHQVFASFEKSSDHFPKRNFFYSGNPVRKEISVLSPKKDSGKRTVLIFGGSQGAHSINLAVIEALDILKGREVLPIQWIHQTGQPDFARVKGEYEARKIPAVVEPFIYDMAKAYESSDLVICRAGATTLAELSACGKPAILIPFPFAAHHHQEKNARFLKEMGAAEVLEPPDLNGKALANMIVQILFPGEKLAQMSEKMRGLGKKDAAENIIERCLRLRLAHV